MASRNYETNTGKVTEAVEMASSPEAFTVDDSYCLKGLMQFRELIQLFVVLIELDSLNTQ